MAKSKRPSPHTVEERLSILEEMKTIGVVQASRTHGVSTTTLYNWRNAFEAHGREGLDPQKSKTLQAMQQRLREAQRENEQLKLLVAEKELELRVKNALLQKKASLKISDS